MGVGLGLKALLKTFGHWGLLDELYKLQGPAGSLKDVYDSYLDSPDHFTAWQRERDSVMDRVYDLTGADPKY